MKIVFLLLLLIALGVHGGGITGPGGCTDPIPLFQLPGFDFPKIFQKSFAGDANEGQNDPNFYGGTNEAPVPGSFFDVLNKFNKLFGPVPGAEGFAE
ncbi:unnamed protein product [Caenorhabditis auriculariae]|uniref:Uncharacterized protein n=1 Tax=Caenorhabditis auriculariae TaxID=2777116 RepID=A0A8S1H316_9PELO|nr:unnamed protein product [Caenorhabditis auriculariae]